MYIQHQIGKASEFARLFLPNLPASFNFKSFNDSVKKIHQKFGDLPPNQPKPIDLDEYYRRLRYATHQDVWSEITSRDWKRSPWVFWRDDPCLADHPRFIERYRDFLAKASCGAIKTLIHVYLRDFPKAQKSLPSVAKLIVFSLSKNKSSLLDTWRERAESLALFDSIQGPIKLAQVCWHGNQKVESISATFGLKGELAQGMFIKEAYCHALTVLSNELEHGRADILYQILEWSKKDGYLRYPEYRNTLAEALLLAWHERQPNRAIQNEIQGFLLNLYKHPRLYPANWQGVSVNARSVILRWLAGETIRLFFEVLNKNAKHYDSTAQKHWKYRRAFWWAYYEKDYLHDAWFAFASQARELANNELKPEERNYSNLEGSGVQQNHAVLFMRIGGLTIVEWSHYGKCRIWAENNPTKPNYQRRYNGFNLKWGSEKIKEHYQEGGITHYSSESGGWQADVANFILKHTNINIGYRDYMPKQ